MPVMWARSRLSHGFHWHPDRLAQSAQRVPAEHATQRLTNVTKSVGLADDYEHVHQRDAVVSHELLHLAISKGRQAEMKERLLEAQFVSGEHVGRIPNLGAIAEELDFDGAEVTQALGSRTFLADMKADVVLARECGVHDIPVFVIDGS